MEGEKGIKGERKKNVKRDEDETEAEIEIEDDE